MFILRTIKEIIKSKKALSLNKDDIQKLQIVKFRKLVKYANQYSDFYQKIIKQNNIDINNCFPEDFPILDKQTLIQHFDRIVTDKNITKSKLEDFLSKSTDHNELYLNKYSVIHTSGSSGQIGIYVCNQQELASSSANFSRANKPKMLQKMVFIGATKGHFAGITMSTKSKQLFPFYKDFLALDINDPFEDLLSQIDKFKPTIIGGYPFGIYKLAQAQEIAKINIKPKIINFGGEAINGLELKYIDQVFGCQTTNIYASSEFLLLGIGKSEWENKMMLLDDYVYFEIEQDFTLMTNLFNFTLPLIRYKMNDQLQKTDSPKNAPQGFTFIKNIVGRTEMTPYFVNQKGVEDFISFHIINEIYVKGISKFQMVVTSLNSFILQVNYQNISKEQKLESSKNLTEKIIQILTQKNMLNVKFEILEKDSLWVDPKTGKFKLIIKQ
jgi:phenylacetate-CoA ligase